MIHEVIVTTISEESIVHIAPMGIQIIDNKVTISPFRPSQTLENITNNNLATINFIDDVRVFAGIVTKYKKDWELENIRDKDMVPQLLLANTHYNVIAKEFKDDERRPDIICDICSDITGLEDKYDKIICIAILEHVYDPFKAVSNLQKMLKKNGVIYGMVPYLYHYHAPKDLKFQ